MSRMVVHSVNVGKLYVYFLNMNVENETSPEALTTLKLQQTEHHMLADHGYQLYSKLLELYEEERKMLQLDVFFETWIMDYGSGFVILKVPERDFYYSRNYKARELICLRGKLNAKIFVWAVEMAGKGFSI